MILRPVLLSALTAFALVTAVTAASADGNLQTVDIGIGNFDDGFGDYNAVAVAALQQSSAQIAGSVSEVAVGDGFDGQIDFGAVSFENQTFNTNNFNTGVNAVQGNAMAIATAANGGGGPAIAGLGF